MTGKLLLATMSFLGSSFVLEALPEKTTKTNEILIKSTNGKETIKLMTTGKEKTIEQLRGGTQVTTDFNKDASYILISQKMPVKSGEKLNLSYKITVAAGGMMSVGFLNTAGNGWYGEELVLKPGTHSGTLERVVPEGEKETTLVFRNYHLQNPGQTIFTIEKLQFNKVN
jgi:hypothetical protein